VSDLKEKEIDLMPVDFFMYLKKRLEKPLPGRASHMKMAPKPVSKKASLRKTTVPRDAHPSSVLILIFPDAQDTLKLILTLRTQHINHGGQISLPGGRAETGEKAIETALREAKEEIGIEPDAVQTAGLLSNLYVAHSHNNVKPVAGFLDGSPDLIINPNEVKEAFSIALGLLLDEKNLAVEEWQLHGERCEVPYWNVHRVPLWGATAMILSEFVDLYREFLLSCQ
jgi:8-oxo-dGTP pyrophosphatase MutT (NUDIX family)